MNKIKFFSNPCNIYLTLWCLCEMRGTLYEPGSTISQGLVLIVLLFSIKEYFTYLLGNNRIRTKESNLYFKGVNWLLLMYTIYGLALFITDGFLIDDEPTYQFLQAAYITFLPVFACYVYTIKGYLTITNLQFWSIIFIVVGICGFYYSELMMVEKTLKDGSELTNNAGYIMLSIIPTLLVFNKKPVLMFTGLGICSLFVLISMKRGAILIAAIILFLIVYRQIKGSSRRVKITSIVLVIIGLFVLVPFVESLIQNNDYFYTRIQDTIEGDSSNRDIIYTDLWSIYDDQFDAVEKVIGVGGMGTVKRTGMYAHNDWLEVLFDHGVLGLLIFIYYVICFYRTTRAKSFSDYSRFCLLVVFLIFFLRTFFSMSVTGMSIYMASILGFALADGFSKGLPSNQ